MVEFIQPARWAKNLWNGALSTMCSLSRTPVSALVAPETLAYTLPVVRRTMLEILYVARALGYREKDFPAQSIDDAIAITIQNYGPNRSDSSESAQDVFEDDDEDQSSRHISFKPSMLIDLENGRPMELEPIIGAVLDRARAKAIETPRLDLIYSSLKVLQQQAVQSLAIKLEDQAVHSTSWAMRKPSVGGSGAFESRRAWLNEVRQRTKTGSIIHEDQSGKQAQHDPDNLPRQTPKVTGKPLPF